MKTSINKIAFKKKKSKRQLDAKDNWLFSFGKITFSKIVVNHCYEMQN